MEVIKFAKVDWLKTKSQAKLILGFIVLAIFMGTYMEPSMWPLFYIAFGATIISTTPYSFDVQSSNGFINLLPAKANSRSKGRFLFGTLFVIGSIILGEVSLILFYLYKGELPNYIFEIFSVIVAVALILNAFQFLALSFFKFKSQQVMQLIRMIPPFIMFYGGNYLREMLNSGNEKVLERFSLVLRFCMDHKMIVSVGLLFVAIVITYISAIISGFSESNRER